MSLNSTQEATAARGLFAREVDDHKHLWESEVKSRSKLGLRVRTDIINYQSHHHGVLIKLSEMSPCYCSSFWNQLHFVDGTLSTM